MSTIQKLCNMRKEYKTIRKQVGENLDLLKNMTKEQLREWVIAGNLNRDLSTISRFNEELEKVGIDYLYETISHRRLLSRGWTKEQVKDNIKPIFGVYFDLYVVRMIETKNA